MKTLLLAALPFSSSYVTPDVNEAQIIHEAQHRAILREAGIALPGSCFGCQPNPSNAGEIAHSGNVTFLDLSQVPAVECEYTINYSFTLELVSQQTFCTGSGGCPSKTCRATFQMKAVVSATYVSGSTGEEDTAIIAAGLKYKCPSGDFQDITEEMDGYLCPLTLSATCGGMIERDWSVSSRLNNNSTDSLTGSVTCPACYEQL